MDLYKRDYTVEELEQILAMEEARAKVLDAQTAAAEREVGAMSDEMDANHEEIMGIFGALIAIATKVKQTDDTFMALFHDMGNGFKAAVTDPIEKRRKQWQADTKKLQDMMKELDTEKAMAEKERIDRECEELRKRLDESKVELAAMKADRRRKDAEFQEAANQQQTDIATLLKKIKEAHSKRMQLDKQKEAERKMLLVESVKDNEGGKRDGAAGGSN